MKDAILEIPCPSLHSQRLEFSLLQQILDLKIPISHSCGGNGTCGTCRVIVLEGVNHLSPRDDHEAEFAKSRDFSEVERLACQSFCQGPIKVKVCQLDE